MATATEATDLELPARQRSREPASSNEGMATEISELPVNCLYSVFKRMDQSSLAALRQCNTWCRDAIDETIGHALQFHHLTSLRRKGPWLAARLGGSVKCMQMLSDGLAVTDSDAQILSAFDTLESLSVVLASSTAVSDAIGGSRQETKQKKHRNKVVEYLQSRRIMLLSKMSKWSCMSPTPHRKGSQDSLQGATSSPRSPMPFLDLTSLCRLTTLRHLQLHSAVPCQLLCKGELVDPAEVRLIANLNSVRTAAAMCHLHNLRCLSVVDIDLRVGMAMERAFGHLTALESLTWKPSSVPNSGLSDEAMRIIANTASQLRHMDVRVDQCASFAGVQHLSLLDGLEHLSLRIPAQRNHNGVGAGVVQLLASCGRRLKHLQLQPVSPAPIDQLPPNSLGGLTALHIASVWASQVQSLLATAVAPGTLREVDIQDIWLAPSGSPGHRAAGGGFSGEGGCEIFQPLARSAGTLRSLRLHISTVKDGHLSCFSFLEPLKQLTRLDLTCMDAFADHHAGFVRQLTQLQELRLVASDLLSDQGLLACCNGLKQLTQLCLADCRRISVPGVGRMLARLPQLHSLQLRTFIPTLSVNKISSLQAALGTLSSIRQLDLTGCGDLDDRDLRALERLRQLHSLDLSRCLGLTGVTSLLRLASVRWLSLWGCKIMYTSMIQLRRMRSLQDLVVIAEGHRCSGWPEWFSPTVHGLPRLCDVIRSLPDVRVHGTSDAHKLTLESRALANWELFLPQTPGFGGGARRTGAPAARATSAAAI